MTNMTQLRDSAPASDPRDTLLSRRWRELGLLASGVVLGIVAFVAVLPGVVLGKQPPVL